MNSWILLGTLAACHHDAADCYLNTDHHPLTSVSRSGGGPEETSTWTYDADMHLLSTETDDDGDGRPDSRSSLTWEGGLLRTMENDNGADGTIDDTTTWEYDGEGHLLRVTADGVDAPVPYTTTNTWDGDDQLTSVTLYPDRAELQDAWTYDDRHHKVAWDSYSEAHDEDWSDFEQHETYDADGHTLTSDSLMATPDIDGTMEDSTEDAWTWEDGRLVAWEHVGRFGRNGTTLDTTRSSVAYYYDGQGDLVRAETDADDDGTVDGVETYTWDDGHHMLTREGDGYNETWTYDSAGDVLTDVSANDWNSDGPSDSVWATTNTWDGHRNLLTQTVEESYENSYYGTTQESRSYMENTWAGCEVLPESRTDSDGDGTFEQTTTYAD